jgi:hypothetical protein
MTKYFDFDGTLAYFDTWKGQKHTGKPIPEMVKKCLEARATGDEVVIFTARMTHDPVFVSDPHVCKQSIEEWCIKNLGVKLPITNVKGPAEVIYDDRAVRIVKNTGLTEGEFLGRIIFEELESGSTKKQALNRVLTAIEIIGG